MEELTEEELTTLKYLLKTEIQETKMIRNSADSDDDKEELADYLDTLLEIESKLFGKKSK